MFGPLRDPRRDAFRAGHRAKELGEFGVLPRHIPFLTVLQPGIVKVRGPSGVLRFQVGAGFAEAGPDRVVLLVDSCDEIK